MEFRLNICYNPNLNANQERHNILCHIAHLMSKLGLLTGDLVIESQ